MGRQGKYPAEIRERAVKLVLDHHDEYESQWAAVTSIAAKVGCSRESLRKWIRQAERDSGKREMIVKPIPECNRKTAGQRKILDTTTRIVERAVLTAPTVDI